MNICNNHLFGLILILAVVGTGLIISIIKGDE